MKSEADFSKRLASIPASLWENIAKIDEIKGRWVGGVKLSPQTLGRLKRSVLVTSTGASTRIEGSRLSDEEIAKLMQGLRVGTWKSRDEQEVRGYHELLGNVFDAWETLSFNESLIKHLHKELLKYVEKDERYRGEYKKTENSVVAVDSEGKMIGVIFETTLAYLTPKKMNELVLSTERALETKEIHPLITIGNFIVEFLRIHPFQDGNGRLSRVLTNFLLLRAGYAYMPYVSHEKIIEDNKSDYYLALRTSQKSFGTAEENIVPWLEFFFSVFLKQSQLALELLGSEQVGKLLSPKQKAVWEYLQTVRDASPAEMMQATSLKRSTLNQVLSKLIAMNQIEKLSTGRTTRYVKL